MVDFRKSLLLLAVLIAVGSVASAQVPPAFQCTANAGVTPLVRAESLAELVGDVVLNCSGGTPAPPGPGTVQKVNVRIFLNVNVTSALLDGNWNESILSIDDPLPPNQRPCAANNCSISGVGGLGVNYALPAGDVVNVFQGTWISPNQVEWLGVPIDPPGTGGGTRIIRITNVRANANQLGVSGTLIPSNITMFISATGSSSIPINNPTQVVAFVQDGMSVATLGNNRFLQCVSAPPISGTDASGPCAADAYVRFRENFATAFKTRGDATVGQSTFGQVNNTESGFSNPILTNAHGINRAGIASQGTRFIGRFANIPANATLRVWSLSVGSSVPPGAPAPCPPGTLAGDRMWNSTNVAAAVGGADSVGAGGTPSPTAEWRSVSLSGGAGSATWEIIASDPFAADSVYFALDITFTAGSGSGAPALGTGSFNGSFAPISTVVTASSTAPVPRFFDDSASGSGDIFSINPCSTTLLYPFVTNLAGFDTGLVISNTSRDPFGTPTQEGTCSVNYYGFTTGGGAAPAAVTTPRVAAGSHAVWTLSSGGTVQTGGGTVPAAPGFQGYIIAVCNFQFAHGYAFISDIGSGRLAQGYLALVMDEAASTVPRSKSNSEPLGQ
jgi:hypothetical protein